MLTQIQSRTLISYALVLLINLLTLATASKWTNNFDDDLSYDYSKTHNAHSYRNLARNTVSHRYDFQEPLFASRAANSKSLANGTIHRSGCGRYLCGFRSVCGRSTVGGKRNQGRLIDLSEGSRIAYGVDAKRGEFPQYVRLVRKNEGLIPGFKLCGGVLISDKHVLTAAHCVSEMDGSVAPVEPFVLYVGDHDQFSYDTTEKKHKVKSICRAKGFRSYRRDIPHNDWAVLTLSDRVRFNKYVQPACLPAYGDDIRMKGERSECYVMGFGAAQIISIYGYLIEQFPKVLQKMRVVKSSCFSWLRVGEDVSRHCFSGFYSGSDSCGGDSGSPVLCRSGGRFTIVGLVSYGAVLCNGETAVFTNVPKIVNNIYRECGI